MKGLFLLCALLCALARGADQLQVIISGTVVFSAKLYNNLCVRDDGRLPKTVYIRKLSAGDKRWLFTRVKEDYGIAFNEGPRTLMVDDSIRVYLFTYQRAALGKEYQYAGVAYWRDGEEYRSCVWRQESPGFATAVGEPVVKRTKAAQEDLDALLERTVPVEAMLKRVDE